MVSRYILLLFSFLALQASAKQAFNEEEDEDAAYKIKNIHKMAEMPLTIIDSLAPEQEARLFMPLTFYKGVAHRLFSLDEDAASCSAALLDDALLNIYLKRPDLIESKESEIDKVAPPVDTRPIVVAAPISESKHNVTEVNDIIEAPEPEIVLLKPNFWSFKGDYFLQFMQNYVSGNWYKGGEKNYSFLASAILEANYNNKQKVRWDNKLELKVGAQTSSSDTIHKVKTNTDLMRLTTRLGLQATRKWYYTIQGVASTQMFRGFGGNSDKVLSDFLSPLTFNLSIGMDYKPSYFKGKLTGNVHLAPLAYNLKFVDRKNLNTRYGIESDRQALNDFGSQLTIDLTWQMSSMIKWRSRLYGYTTYERAEMEWENTFSFQFNKYISSMLYIYPRFDDSKKRDKDYGYFQLKEYISFGFAYSM